MTSKNVQPDRNDSGLRLACADFSFPLLTHDQSLGLISQLGFQGVDIGLFPNRSHVRPEDCLDDIPAAAERLKRMTEKHGLILADFYFQSGAGLEELAENHPDPEQRRLSRERFQRALELAVLCGATHMTTLPGIQWKDRESAEDSLKRAAEELAWRTEQAKPTGIPYAVEPHMWSVAPTPELALQLVEQAPGLTLTLDYGHFTAQGIADDPVEPLLDHASHFHARAAGPNLLQTNLRSNTINYPRIVERMKTIGYKSFLGVEYVVMEGVEVVAEVDNLSETILLRDLLREAMESAS